MCHLYEEKTEAWLIALADVLPARDSPSLNGVADCNYNFSANSTTSHHRWRICWTVLRKHSVELLICLGFQDNLAARGTLVSNQRSSDAGCQINPGLSMPTYSVLSAKTLSRHLPAYWSNPIKMHHGDTIMCSFVQQQSIPFKEICRNQ